MSHSAPIPYTTNPAHVANVATQMARTAPHERMALAYSGVALGCMVLMGLAAGMHVYKEFTRRDDQHNRPDHGRHRA